MRILVAHPGPQFSVQDVYTGWCEGLRAAGQHVFPFNLDDRLSFYGMVFVEAGEGMFKRALTPEQTAQLAVDTLYSAMMKVRPHLLLAVSAFFLPAELFDIARAAGVKVAILHTESPYEDDRQAEIGQHADVNLLNDPTNTGRFSNAHYFPHAYRPDVHFPPLPVALDPDIVSDFVFVGTGFPSRVEFFETMLAAPAMDGVDVALGGNWQNLADGSPLRKRVAHDIEDCVDNADTASLYRASKVGLNLYRREAQRPELAAGWAMGPREVEMAASGLMFLRDPRGEGDELLPMLPTFDGPEDAAEKVRWWLRHSGARQEAARRAREAIADRTFTNHARRLMRLLEGE